MLDTGMDDRILWIWWTQLCVVLENGSHLAAFFRCSSNHRHLWSRRESVKQPQLRDGCSHE
ncbi:hypothetical protein ACLOJK_012129, partial [Asimina triloba]